MSAQLDTLPCYQRMTAADLDAVTAIEERIYPHPWTRGNFADSLDAGYPCWIAERRGAIAGYGVLAIAAREAHLLNLSVAAEWQRHGLGSALLRFMVRLAADHAADRIFLEVRPSNIAARALYARTDFREIGIRCGYYPAPDGREDALVLELELK